MILKSAAIYFAVVFATAFAVGALRVTLIAPKIGVLASVALEVPLILGLSWFVAGRMLQRWPLTRLEALAMGGLAFAVLMSAEFALAVLTFGESPASYAIALVTPSGALGLAGQIGFALIPALRTQTKG